MTIHNIKLSFEQNNGGVKNLEASLAQQIEWANELRNKIKQEEAKNQQNHEQLDNAIKDLSDRVVNQLRAQPNQNSGDLRMTDDIRQALAALQKSDMD